MPSFPMWVNAALRAPAGRSPERRAMTVIDILPPEPRSARRRFSHGATGNVADASFVTVPAASRRSGPVAERPTPPRPRSTRHVAAQEKPSAGAVLAWVERGLMNLSADVFAAIVAALCVAVFGLAGGFALFVSESAPAEPPGLDLTHVNLTPQDANGMSLLLIKGSSRTTVTCRSRRCRSAQTWSRVMPRLPAPSSSRPSQRSRAARATASLHAFRILVEKCRNCGFPLHRRVPRRHDYAIGGLLNQSGEPHARRSRQDH